MDIAELGKHGLINKLTADVNSVNASTISKIGDDAALLQYGDKTLAVCTRSLIEGISFDLTYFPLQHLGYKAAISSFSNIYAMNAAPRQLLVSIAVSAKFSVEAIERLYKGIKLACERHSVDLVGGDTAPSVTGLSINVTAIGEAIPENITCRNTAQIGDLICVSGNLGAAYMGLQVLEREKKLFAEDKTITPKLDDYKYIVARCLKPEARRDIVEFFSSIALKPSSMINISSGLSSELLKICNASKTGCEIHYHKIPIDDQTRRTAEELNIEPLIPALYGGDDFELLFTVPVNSYDKLIGKDDISIIGYLTEPDKGRFLQTENGTRIELK